MFTRRFLREMYGKLEQRKSTETNTAKLNSGCDKTSENYRTRQSVRFDDALLRSEGETCG